jgi:hypothetical protein
MLRQNQNCARVSEVIYREQSHILCQYIFAVHSIMSTKGGWEKLRKRKAQIERNEEEIRKTRKIDGFLKPKTAALVVSSNNMPVEITSSSDHSISVVENNVPIVGSNISVEFNASSAISTDTISESDSSYIPINSDPALWPKTTGDLVQYFLNKGSFEQNIRDTFPDTKKIYTDKGKTKLRYLNKSNFIKQYGNHEVRPRKWMIYSASEKKVFCGPCMLFSIKTSTFSSFGFDDWKHIDRDLQIHEISDEHKSAVVSFAVQRSASTLDSSLLKAAEKSKSYWKEILLRLVTVIQKMTERNMPFRGKNEKFNSPHNGCYLGILEIVASFDATLAKHIDLYANKQKGSTSYLSSTICDEIIELMGNEVLKLIVYEIKKAKYYSVSVDSTPDRSHTDQLTFVIRYVLKGVPVERFLKFIPIVDHTGKHLSDTIIKFLFDYEIDISDCRGQSYDNASNMSGIYNGCQKFIRYLNSLAHFIPCADHTLNIIGKNGAECCPESIEFFEMLKELYNLFSSPRNWNLLESLLKESSAGHVTKIKNLCHTRWSARHESVKSLLINYSEILIALQTIRDDCTREAVTRHKANSLLSKLYKLETAILTTLWQHLLERIQAVSIHLQSTNIDLSTALIDLKSLLRFLNDQKVQYSYFEAAAKILLKDSNAQYQLFSKSSQQVQQKEFKSSTFDAIFSTLIKELATRCYKYQKLNDTFGVLTKFNKMESSAIRAACENLRKAYPSDFEPSFASEFVHFSAFYRTHFGQKIFDTSIPNVSEMLQVIEEKQLTDMFHNIEIAFRMFLCMMVTNAEGERSFSKLNLIKSDLRTTMGQDRLNSLALLSIECDLARSLDFEKIIDEFASVKVRKVKF